MKLQLTTNDAKLLVALLEAGTEGEVKLKKPQVSAALILRKRIEDLQGKAPKGSRETRWAASVVAALAEHEDTCTLCLRTFRKCSEDLDLHEDLALGCG